MYNIIYVNDILFLYLTIDHSKRKCDYMHKLTYTLLPKLRSRKHNLNVEIDLYSYATELYNELDRIDIINRVKETPQLGVIKIPHLKLGKTRYDYIMLQLYLHKIIKGNLQAHMRYTYNNVVKSKEFELGKLQFTQNDTPTIGDILQLLTIIYNIGHFYNTFTASRAIILAADKNDSFDNYIVNISDSERFKSTATKILKRRNYHRFHLLNSLLVLEKCDQSKKSVSLCIELLYTYLNEEELSSENKLRYVFDIFKKIRTVSYIAYDLQIANTPLTVDLCNEKAMVLFLKELISEYNNTQSTNHLIKSITKLLDDTVYNENSNAICYYNISRKMTSLLLNYDYCSMSYYEDLFLNKESILNRQYPQHRDYMQTQILKLTFEQENVTLAEKLISILEHMNNIRVGYYDRYTGEKTILVSIRRKCSSNSKIIASLKVLKYSISLLRQIPNIQPTDSRFLLCTKFFLFYLFNENPIVIKPTINKTKCVICTRGKNNRKVELINLLSSSNANEDENHEVHYLYSKLKNDLINDTSITVPASILVYKKDSGQKLCEFDGIIIHPMRHNQQVIFLEAKNTASKPIFAKNCLKKKFDKIGLQYSVSEIYVDNFDAYFNYSI